jgi:fucose permease
MGVQDAACPVIFLKAFPAHYPSAMSAGQAFFGAGCFMPSLALGFILRGDLPFLYVYYLFAGLCIFMLVLWPFMEPEHGGPAERTKKTGGERPPKLRPFLWVIFGAICVFYCAATNTIGLYTISYGVSAGIPPERAVYLVTFYNIGGMLGSLIFSAVLRQVKPVNLLCTNLGAVLLCFITIFFIRNFIPLSAVYFLAGLGLGVLFSILVILAVELYSGSAGRAGALVAMICGGADIITPLVTGVLITAGGIAVNLWFIRGALLLALTASLFFRSKIRHKEAFSKPTEF